MARHLLSQFCVLVPLGDDRLVQDPKLNTHLFGFHLDDFLSGVFALPVRCSSVVENHVL